VTSGVQTWDGLQGQPGYRWSMTIDDRTLAVLVAEWVGKRLADRPAQWAGDPTIRLEPRRYGLVYPEHIRLDVAWFKDQLRTYGIELATSIAYPSEITAQQSQVRVATARFRDADVTSVIGFFEPVYGVLFTTQATQDRYRPEWIVTGYAANDTMVIGKLMDQMQWSQAFGIGPIGVPVEGHVHNQDDVYRWGTGRAPEDAIVAGSLCNPMWLFLIGAQLAGPNLTPETFESGMFSWTPCCGRWQGHITLGNQAMSFGRHGILPWVDYNADEDITEKWWDLQTTGTDEINLTAPGVYWKLEGGRRYLPGEIASGEPAMFVKDGAVSSIPEYPPNETPPSYPPPNRA